MVSIAGNLSLLSEQILGAIKSVTDNYVFLQDNAPVHLHSARSNCCSAGLSTSFLIIYIYSPVTD